MSRRFDFERLVELCRLTHEEARRSAVQATERSLVVRNWLIGWHVVEYEQQGSDRAEYGAQTLKNLSGALKSKIGRGFSVRSLEQYRRFYLQFEGLVPQLRKSQTLSAISAAAHNPQTPSAKLRASTGRDLSRLLRSASPALLQQFTLGWSHDVQARTHRGRAATGAVDGLRDPTGLVPYRDIHRTAESEIAVCFVIDSVANCSHIRATNEEAVR